MSTRCCRDVLRRRGRSPPRTAPDRRADAAERLRLLYGGWKEQPTEYLNGKSPRKALQTLGTEWGRRNISKSLWLDIWKQRIAAGSAINVVADDVRFQNEVDAIHALDGVVVRIRPKKLILHHPDPQASEEGYTLVNVDFEITNYSTIELAGLYWHFVDLVWIILFTIVYLL